MPTATIPLFIMTSFVLPLLFWTRGRKDRDSSGLTALAVLADGAKDLLHLWRGEKFAEKLGLMTGVMKAVLPEEGRVASFDEIIELGRAGGRHLLDTPNVGRREAELHGI